MSKRTTRRARGQLHALPTPAPIEALAQDYERGCKRLGDLHVHRLMLDAEIDALEAHLLDVQKRVAALPPPQKAVTP